MVLNYDCGFVLIREIIQETLLEIAIVGRSIVRSGWTLTLVRVCKYTFYLELLGNIKEIRYSSFILHSNK